MTTKDLIKWCMAAETKCEESWDNEKNRYKFSLEESIRATKPKNAVATEVNIAFNLVYHNWNEVQTWAEEMV